MIKTLGCIDSGMGGILVLDALVKEYSNINVVFIADQKHAPYGEKSKEQLFEYACAMMKEFKRRNIADVLIACNTICANVYDELCQTFPELNLIGIIKPTISQISENTNKIGVLATSKTIQSHVYKTEIKKVYPDVEVIEVACPKIVPLIEECHHIDEIQQTMLEYLKEINDVDACILGCTHYPLLKNTVTEQLKCNVYDSNQAIIDYLDGLLELSEGRIEIFTTSDPVSFENNIKKLISRNWKVNKISL